MEFLTESYFRREASRIELFEQRTFSDRARRDTSTTARFDVFLSYNIADIEVRVNRGTGTCFERIDINVFRSVQCHGSLDNHLALASIM